MEHQPNARGAGAGVVQRQLALPLAAVGAGSGAGRRDDEGRRARCHRQQGGGGCSNEMFDFHEGSF